MMLCREDDIQYPKAKKRLKIPLTPMGVLAPGSAHARLSAQPPIDTIGNFSAYLSEALASFL